MKILSAPELDKMPPGTVFAALCLLEEWDLKGFIRFHDAYPRQLCMILSTWKDEEGNSHIARTDDGVLETAEHYAKPKLDNWNAPLATDCGGSDSNGCYNDEKEKFLVLDDEDIARLVRKLLFKIPSV